MNGRSSVKPVGRKGYFISQLFSKPNEALLVYEDDDQIENDISM
jgi:hypothetical protein